MAAHPPSRAEPSLRPCAAAAQGLDVACCALVVGGSREAGHSAAGFACRLVPRGEQAAALQSQLRNSVKLLLRFTPCVGEQEIKRAWLADRSDRSFRRAKDAPPRAKLYACSLLLQEANYLVQVLSRSASSSAGGSWCGQPSSAHVFRQISSFARPVASTAGPSLCGAFACRPWTRRF